MRHFFRYEQETDVNNVIKKNEIQYVLKKIAIQDKTIILLFSLVFILRHTVRFLHDLTN